VGWVASGAWCGLARVPALAHPLKVQSCA